jgi:hypothetical protein
MAWSWLRSNGKPDVLSLVEYGRKQDSKYAFGYSWKVFVIFVTFNEN